MQLILVRLFVQAPTNLTISCNIKRDASASLLFCDGDLWADGLMGRFEKNIVWWAVDDSVADDDTQTILRIN